MVIVAQLVRALGCGSKGRGFESRLSPSYINKYLIIFMNIFFLICNFLFLSSYKPIHKISKHEIINVLTEIEISKGIAQNADYESEEIFIQNVIDILEKKNISVDDFKTEISFYSQNIQEFIDIYEQVEKNLEEFQNIND